MVLVEVQRQGGGARAGEAVVHLAEGEPLATETRIRAQLLAHPLEILDYRAPRDAIAADVVVREDAHAPVALAEQLVISTSPRPGEARGQAARPKRALRRQAQDVVAQRPSQPSADPMLLDAETAAADCGEVDGIQRGAGEGGARNGGGDGVCDNHVWAARARRCHLGVRR